MNSSGNSAYPSPPSPPPPVARHLSFGHPTSRRPSKSDTWARPPSDSPQGEQIDPVTAGAADASMGGSD
eukprot:392716-Prorocentrum_minimum.AAC.1